MSFCIILVCFIVCVCVLSCIIIVHAAFVCIKLITVMMVHRSRHID